MDTKYIQTQNASTVIVIVIVKICPYSFHILALLDIEKYSFKFIASIWYISYIIWCSRHSRHFKAIQNEACMHMHRGPGDQEMLSSIEPYLVHV